MQVLFIFRLFITKTNIARDKQIIYNTDIKILIKNYEKSSDNSDYNDKIWL